MRGLLFPLLILPLLRPEIPVAIPLRSLNPSFDLPAAEESRLTRFVVRDASKHSIKYDCQFD